MKKVSLYLISVGVVIGVAISLVTDEGNRFSETDAFCVSCHVMDVGIAQDPVFIAAPHQNNSSGVRAQCRDCHLPKSNFVVEGIAHASQGIKDIVALFQYDYDDPAVWKQRRPTLAYSVRDHMLANDSAACRSCHDATLIQPQSQQGVEAHNEMVLSGEKTCIQCHFNLVHSPVKPRLEFIRHRNDR